LSDKGVQVGTQSFKISYRISFGDAFEDFEDGRGPDFPRRMRSIRPHAAPLQQTRQGGAGGPAWMAGTSPAMTVTGQNENSWRAHDGLDFVCDENKYRT